MELISKYQSGLKILIKVSKYIHNYSRYWDVEAVELSKRKSLKYSLVISSLSLLISSFLMPLKLRVTCNLPNSSAFSLFLQTGTKLICLCL